MRLLLLATSLAAGLLSFNAFAATPQYTLGEYYKAVENPAQPADPSKIVVQEFFWFGCPHCFRLDPLLTAWRKTLPKDVVFERVPNNLGHPVGVIDEKAFYVARALGIEDKIHTPLFRAIHVDHAPLTTNASLREFFIKTAGITAKQYNDAYDSFEVDSGVRRADKLAINYGILAVPTLVVGGEYKVEAGMPAYADKKGSETDHYHMMLKTLDYLIDKVRAERKSG